MQASKQALKNTLHKWTLKQKILLKSQKGYRDYSLKGKKKESFMEQRFTELETSCIINVAFLVLNSSAIKCYGKLFKNISVIPCWDPLGKTYFKNHVRNLKGQRKVCLGFSPLLDYTCANSC